MLHGRADNSALLQGRDSVYIKARWGANGTFNWPANTTGVDVLVGRSPLNELLYFEMDSIMTADTSSGGWSPQGLGFIKANGSTVTYDNTTYQPFITGTGVNTNYYSGNKTFLSLPIYTASEGIQKIGTNFQLGGNTNDLSFTAVDNTKNLLFGSSTDANKYNSIFFNAKDNSSIWMGGGGISFVANGHNLLSFYRSATYNGEYSAFQTNPNAIPSVLRVRQIVSDSIKNIEPSFPQNTTGQDVLVGLAPDDSKIYFKLDSLQSGTTLNGNGFVKAAGAIVSYDNQTYQPLSTAWNTSNLNLPTIDFTTRKLMLGGALGTPNITGSLTHGNVIMDSYTSGYGVYIQAYNAGQTYIGMGGGRVSINKGSPAYQLDVAGDINSTTGLRIAGVLLNKSHVGLSNVTNTADVDKPVSTLQAASIATKQATLVSGTNIKTINGTTILGVGDLVISGGSSHNAVTLGTANGLSLATQVLSLAMAGTASTGALSYTDWNMFNNKTSFPGFGTTVSTAAYGNHLHAGVYQPSGSYQGLLSGTGLVRMAGTSVSYDNVTYQPASTAWNTSNLNLPTIDFNAKTLTLGRTVGTANIKGAVAQGDVIMDSYSNGYGVYLQNYTDGHVYLASGGGSVKIGDNIAPTERLEVNGNIKATSGLFAGNDIRNTISNVTMRFGYGAYGLLGTDAGWGVDTNVGMTWAIGYARKMSLATDGSLTTTGSVIANNGKIYVLDKGNGSLELATYAGALPGYPSSNYPTLVSTGTIFFSSGGVYSGSISTNNLTMNGNIYGANVDVTGSYKVNGVPLNFSHVGLGNVNNTSDANKPISIATQAKFDIVDNNINFKQDALGNAIKNGDVVYGNTNGTTGWLRVNKLLGSFFTDVQSVNGVTTTLYSCPIPASQLENNGDMLKIKVYLQIYSTSAGLDGTVQMSLGASAVISTGTPKLGTYMYTYDITIQRTSATTVRISHLSMPFDHGIGEIISAIDEGTATLSGALNFNVNAQYTGGWVKGKSMTVEFIPYGY